MFRDLNVVVPRGVTVLLGPNGAGKTTLLHTIVGLKRPEAGSLRVLGHDVLRRGGLRAVAARIGFLPQVVSHYPGYTVRESIAYAAWLKNVPRRDIGAKVDRVLGLMSLSGRAGSRMGSLSGGLLRRAGIAQALVHEPELVILDEPAAGLDPQQRIELRRVLRKVAGSAAVLVSTHVVADARHVADTIIVLNEGAVVFTGTVCELEGLARPGVDGDSDLERGYLTALRQPVVCV
ncbi:MULTISPECIES: ATP-binding cassette domain-containing protein [unclassified Micromonospora]|uniref:ATP-binding cassette domain-containing protein n=1 Tax=unclassified Micromonospora TaxID=2617518 RepID=UPI0022B7031E|nr:MULTISPECIES: ATP-binding cassette domain-containing protein [unclassified Micromonospora]MCZ7421653.1 ATP-binding cassette domain-containing protein [Verrucosispora sp. WMMA2121]WBB93668.1 ATP-binding cassette domain-containing protein [Verrucosispora sp. WMMC514]